MVVHCHAIDLQMLLTTSFQQHFRYLQNFGAIGVDVFFVISGFIISYISRAEHGVASAKDFMLRRWVRVAPAYYIASIILFILFFLSQHFAFHAPQVIKTFTILPLFDHGPRYWSPVLVIGWTLSFEFLFYILSAILIAFSIARKDAALLLVLTILYLFGVFVPVSNAQFNFVTSPMILEFGFGVIIAMVYKQRRLVPPVISVTLVVTGLAMFARLIWQGYGGVSELFFILESKSVEQRIILWGLPAAALCAGAIWLEKAKPHLIGSNRFLLLLGDASYSIYLAHPLCYAMLGSLVKRVPFLAQLQGDVLILIFMTLATASGILFHFYIEKPLISKLNGMLLHKKVPAQQAAP